MPIRSAQFIISNSDARKCPKTEAPEYAFIGRSNVGKSSLINMLVGIKGLAKTSSQPGKTQLINHFSINQNEWYLVDLPGYGYARASKENREKWNNMIRHYLLERENLYCVFVLIDGRLEPQKSDLEFMAWLGEKHVPFCIIITKVDKISLSELDRNTSALKKSLNEHFNTTPQIFTSSANAKKGKEEIICFIEGVNKS